MRPDADTTWFNFTAQSGDFRVYAFSGMEQVSCPYEFAVDLVACKLTSTFLAKIILLTLQFLTVFFYLYTLALGSIARYFYFHITKVIFFSLIAIFL